MPTDLLLADDLGLQVVNGDLVLGESMEQHLRLLLESEQGEWREHPCVGVGIQSLLLDEASPLTIQKVIQGQLVADGVQVTELELRTDGKLHVQGYYK